MAARRAATGASGWARAFGVLARNRLALVGVGLVSLFVFTAGLAPWLSPYEPDRITITVAMQPPSLDHWMGTDHLGRDILSRVIHGARIAFVVSVGAVLLGATIGIPLGFLSGYARGWVDHAVMRLMDALLAFPGRLLAIALVAAMGGGLLSLWIAISVSSLPKYARIARAAMLEQRERDYVYAGQVVGESHTVLVSRYIFPNTVAPLTVALTIDFASAILIASSLSFLGLGFPPPTPDWGADLSSAMDGMEFMPWAAIFPGMALSLTILGFNLLGDGMRDVFDPRHYDQ